MYYGFIINLHGFLVPLSIWLSIWLLSIWLSAIRILKGERPDTDTDRSPYNIWFELTEALDEMVK